MPRMDGITAIEHLRKDHPQVAIVILTTYNEDDLMIRGLQCRRTRISAERFKP